MMPDYTQIISNAIRVLQNFVPDNKTTESDKVKKSIDDMLKNCNADERKNLFLKLVAEGTKKKNEHDKNTSMKSFLKSEPLIYSQEDLQQVKWYGELLRELINHIKPTDLKDVDDKVIIEARELVRFEKKFTTFAFREDEKTKADRTRKEIHMNAGFMKLQVLSNNNNNNEKIIKQFKILSKLACTERKKDGFSVSTTSAKELIKRLTNDPSLRSKLKEALNIKDGENFENKLKEAMINTFNKVDIKAPDFKTTPSPGMR